MSIAHMVEYALVGLVVLLIGFLIYRRLPKKLKADSFTQEWRELQTLLRDKTQWPEAITRADGLLDKALKKRKFKGKSMGERMVSAQRKFTNNDDLWFAHNLRKKITADPAMKLKEIDVKEALIGFRQALKDLGAFHAPETTEQQDAKKEDKK